MTDMPDNPKKNQDAPNGTFSYIYVQLFMSCFDTAGEKPETLAAMQIEIRL